MARHIGLVGRVGVIEASARGSVTYSTYGRNDLLRSLGLRRGSRGQISWSDLVVVVVRDPRLGSPRRTAAAPPG
eukprot:scaffold74477_cov48-Phaeocystis_antarctica.AAC.1